MSKKKKQVDYRSYLFLAISLTSIGLMFAVAINHAFISILATGLCLIAISLADKTNCNKTKNTTKNRRSEVIK